MSDVESPLATRAAILTSVGVSASQPEAGARPAAAAGAAPDAVGAQPALGPPDVPAGLHALVQADGLVQGGPGILFVAAPGQHDGQVLQRGGQFHRRADRPVVRHGLPRAGPDQTQAVRGTAGWPRPPGPAGSPPRPPPGRPAPRSAPSACRRRRARAGPGRAATGGSGSSHRRAAAISRPASAWPGGFPRSAPATSACAATRKSRFSRSVRFSMGSARPSLRCWPAVVRCSRRPAMSAATPCISSADQRSRRKEYTSPEHRWHRSPARPARRPTGRASTAAPPRWPRSRDPGGRFAGRTRGPAGEPARPAAIRRGSAA